MNSWHFIYNCLASGLAMIVLPMVWCHGINHPERKKALAQRLGYDQHAARRRRRTRPTIWIHAVSVGEVKAAGAIVAALDAVCPDGSILLTTTTTSGQRYARRQFSGRASVQYAPIDLWWAVARFIAAQRPDMLVCLETEIWPNWITKAHLSGIATVFLNGRISPRSIRSYRLIRPLIKPVLERVDAFSMISEADARRIIGLGAPAKRVHINGNVKTDVLEATENNRFLEHLRQIYAVGNHTPVFVAGSIRGAEAEMLMRAYEQLAKSIPGLVFIVAPRHIEKSSRIATLARNLGIDWQYRTDLERQPGFRQAPVVILNTIGELRNVYGLASVVFCGGSLVPLGGQNVLEPAVWGKPVLFGPSMEDFEEARALLEKTGGGQCVPDIAALVEKAGRLLGHPEEARRLGRLAKRSVLANQGAASRHAEVVTGLLAKMVG
ncbi:MAG: glycosyltransferase N-terminal domain-containing protein [Desulfosarcina sp.]|jgi:3-deoxy-D-manno-octulosonic-acid transferase